MSGEHDRHGEGLLAAAATTSFTARLERWVADARVDGAARERSRERFLHEAATQDATLGGVLLDLAERQVPVVLSVAGRSQPGVLRALGADFVALARPDREVLVALSAVVLVRTTAGSAPALGDRVLTTELRLTDVLAELAAERARARVELSDGTWVAGELRSVGLDVAVLRTEGDPSGSAYVALSAVREVSTP